MGASTRYPDEFHILVFPRPTNAAESLPAQAPAAVSIPTSGRDKSGVCPGLRVPAELRIEGPARLLIALSGSCFIFVHGRFMRSLHHATPDRLRHAIRQARKRGPKWARCFDVFMRAAINPIGVLSPKKTGSGASCRSSSRPRPSCCPTAPEQSTTGPQRTSSHRAGIHRLPGIAARRHARCATSHLRRERTPIALVSDLSAESPAPGQPARILPPAHRRQRHAHEPR